VVSRCIADREHGSRGDERRLSTSAKLRPRRSLTTSLSCRDSAASTVDMRTLKPRAGVGARTPGDASDRSRQNYVAPSEHLSICRSRQAGPSQEPTAPRCLSCRAIVRVATLPRAPDHAGLCCVGASSAAGSRGEVARTDTRVRGSRAFGKSGGDDRSHSC